MSRVKNINRYTKKHLARMKLAYESAVDAYNKLSLDELRELFNTKDKSKRIGGIYKRALIDICSKKLQQEAIKNSISDTTSSVLDDKKDNSIEVNE